MAERPKQQVHDVEGDRVRRLRLRADGQRPLAVNLEETISLFIAQLLEASTLRVAELGIVHPSSSRSKAAVGFAGRPDLPVFDRSSNRDARIQGEAGTTA